MRSSLSSFAEEPLRDSFPYLALIRLRLLLYSAMNAAFLSFSVRVLAGTACSGVPPSFLVAGLPWVMRSWAKVGNEAWLVLVVMGAAGSVLTGACVEETGTKPGGRGTAFLLNSGEAGSISMSASLDMKADSWADLFSKAFSCESSQA